MLKVLITGSGRCGTTSIAKYLDGLQFNSEETIISQHETDAGKIIRYLIDGRIDEINKTMLGFKNNIEVSPYIALFPSRPLGNVQLISLIRDGRKTVISGFNTGWFENIDDEKYHWSNYVNKLFDGERFTKCCQLWTYVYNKLERWNSSFYRLEDISKYTKIREKFLDQMNIKRSNKPIEVLNQAKKQKKRISEKLAEHIENWGGTS